MVFNNSKKSGYIILIFFLFLPLCLFAQDTSDSSRFKPHSAKKADTIVTKENLLGIKDTIVVNQDTLMITKEVWIRERDSLVIRIDTLCVNNEIILVISNTVFIIKDTVVILQDTVISRDEKVLKQIKEFSERKNFFSRLLKKILIFEDDKPISVAESIEQSDKKYETYEGKVIRKVEIKVLDAFGPSLNNMEREPRNIFEKSGNVLHLQSHKWLIKNKLLFSKDERINSLNVSESERLLRENNYVYDARIMVFDSLNSDSVDILVIVQDVWSINGGAEVIPSKSIVAFNLRDVNFLGMGQQLDSDVRFNPDLPKGYNLGGGYTINNIYKTFITGKVNYRYENGQTTYGAGLNREFFSPAIKWAGGANTDWYHLIHHSTDQDDSLISQPLNFVQGDVWLGYGINISTKRSSYKGSRFIMAGRILRRKHYETPILPDSIPFTFYDNYFYLSSFGIINRRYYKDNYIFRFGRTEDIPEGNLMAIVAGLEEKKNNSRLYFGINMASSRFSNKHGYFYGKIGLGSFYENNRWEEGVFLTNILYFTPLIKINNWKLRHFLGGRFSEGIRQVKGTVININQDQGIRGFSSNLLYGVSKLVINYEMNIFPPLKLLGFQMAGVLFADFAWITDDKKLIDKNNFFPGYGIGLRIRNDHLVFGMIQVMFGYYPNSPSLGQNEFRFFERNKFFYSFDDFHFSRPSTLPFN
jgi:hypothetical protein